MTKTITVRVEEATYNILKKAAEEIGRAHV